MKPYDSSQERCYINSDYGRIKPITCHSINDDNQPISGRMSYIDWLLNSGSDQILTRAK